MSVVICSAQKLNSDSLSVWVTLGVKQSLRVIGFDLLKHWRVAYKLDGSSYDLISVYDLWWTVTHSLDGPGCRSHQYGDSDQLKH